MMSAASIIIAACLFAPSAQSSWFPTTSKLEDDSVAARKLMVDGSCTPPSELLSLGSLSGVVKLQAPNSDAKVLDLEGYCDKYFFGQDGYMRMKTDDERCEFRLPRDDRVKGVDGFIAEEAVASLKFTARIPNPDIGDSDQYTFAQIHGVSTPMLRLVHYGKQYCCTCDVQEYKYDWLWAWIKTGNSENDSKDDPIPIFACPEDDFDVEIELDNGQMTITSSGSTGTSIIAHNIEWSDKCNFFKLGCYPQDGNPEDFAVDIASISYSLDSGENDIGPW